MANIKLEELWELRKLVIRLGDSIRNKDAKDDIEERLNRLISFLEEVNIDRDKYEELKEYSDNLHSSNEMEGLEALVRFIDRIENALETSHKVNLDYGGEFNPETFKNPLSDFDTENTTGLAEEDIKVGAKCVLTGYHTPAGFIFLRSLEDMTRKLYEEETGNTADQNTWGSALGDLYNYYEQLSSQEIRDNGLEALYTALSNLKNFRNEIAHPNKQLDGQDCEEIFYDVRKATNHISSRLNDLESTNPSLTEN